VRTRCAVGDDDLGAAVVIEVAVGVIA